MARWVVVLDTHVFSLEKWEIVVVFKDSMEIWLADDSKYYPLTMIPGESNDSNTCIQNVATTILSSVDKSWFDKLIVA